MTTGLATEEDEWSQFTLGDLCSLITDGKHGDSEDQSHSGFYFLSVKDILGNRLVYENARQITEVDFSETNRRTNLQPGDVLFTNTGTIGRIAIAGDDPRTYRTTFQKSVAILKPRRDLIDPRFLYYLLHFDNANLSEFAAGTTQKNLLLKDIRSFEVKVPPLREQHAIAHILGTLDDKIELNRRMNQTLEAMARVVFQDWFVDFGPVRAKLEGQDPYLPQDLWGMFPDDLEDSELGEIPEGWEVMPLSKVSDVNPESWSSKNRPNGVEYVDLANTKWGVIESTQYFPWNEAPSRARRVLRPGDTLVGTVRPANGSYSFVGNDGLTGSTGFAVLRPSHRRYRELVYLSASAPDNIDWLAHLADGAAYPAVRPETVGETKIAIPTSDTKVLDWFSKTIGPVLDKVETNKTESQSLAAQRDALLPELVPGAWGIGDGGIHA